MFGFYERGSASPETESPGPERSPRTSTTTRITGMFDMTSKFDRPFIAVLAALFCATPGFAQENRGTAEQRAACVPDALRLCGNYIPDAAGVEQCLRQNTSNLSDACRSVFEQGAALVAGRIR